MLTVAKTIPSPHNKRDASVSIVLNHYLANFNRRYQSHFQLAPITQNRIQRLFIGIDQEEQRAFIESQKKHQRFQTPPGSAPIFEPYLDPQAEPAYTLKHTFDIVSLIPRYLLTDFSFEHFFIGALSIAVINIQDRDGVWFEDRNFANLFAKSMVDWAAWQKTVLISIKHQIPIQPTLLESEIDQLAARLGAMSIQNEATISPEKQASIATVTPEIDTDPMIHKIVQLNHLDCLISFVTPTSLNTKDFLGQTPLIIAAALGFTTIVRYLLWQTAELHWSCQVGPIGGVTALDWAYAQGHQDIIALLADAPYNRPLDLAVQLGRINSANTLFEQGFRTDITYFTIAGKPIHQWIILNHLAVAQLLIRLHPALVDQRDSEGYSPLLLATHYGHKTMVRLLLEHHAQTSLVIDLPNSRYYRATALDIALIHAHYEIATLLMQYGTRAQRTFNRLNQRTLFGLIDVNALELVKLLVYANPSLVNQRHQDGYFPVQLAALRGKTDIALCLIDHGAITRSIGPITTSSEATAKALRQRGVSVQQIERWVLIDAAANIPVSNGSTLRATGSITGKPTGASAPSLQAKPTPNK